MSGHTPMRLDVATVTDDEKARARAARSFVHERNCPPPRGPAPCAACPSAAGLALGLRALDIAPRDVQSVRRALHDAVCGSECGPESDHAARTQSKSAAALRKFHDLFPGQSASEDCCEAHRENGDVWPFIHDGTCDHYDGAPLHSEDPGPWRGHNAEDKP